MNNDYLHLALYILAALIIGVILWRMYVKKIAIKGDDEQEDKGVVRYNGWGLPETDEDAKKAG